MLLSLDQNECIFRPELITKVYQLFPLACLEAAVTEVAYVRSGVFTVSELCI